MGSLYRSQHELVFVFKHGRHEHRNNQRPKELPPGYRHTLLRLRPKRPSWTLAAADGVYGEVKNLCVWVKDIQR
jgi:hypothetical protein